MLLKDEYYTLIDSQIDSLTGIFTLAINPDSKIFKGHFPGNPISPGVCGVELIRECASMVVVPQPPKGVLDNVVHQLQSLRIKKISKCRFLAVIRPQDNKNLRISISLTPIGDSSNSLSPTGADAYQLKAKISDDTTDYMSFAGEVE